MPKAVGLHDFTADDEGDLPFSVGDEIEVTDQTEPGEGWWTGRNSQGVVGIFPANHVELVDEGPLQATATHDFAAEDRCDEYASPTHEDCGWFGYEGLCED